MGKANRPKNKPSPIAKPSLARRFSNRVRSAVNTTNKAVLLGVLAGSIATGGAIKVSDYYAPPKPNTSILKIEQLNKLNTLAPKKYELAVKSLLEKQKKPLNLIFEKNKQFQNLASAYGLEKRHVESLQVFSKELGAPLPVVASVFHSENADAEHVIQLASGLGVRQDGFANDAFAKAWVLYGLNSKLGFLQEKGDFKELANLSEAYMKIRLSGGQSINNPSETLHQKLLTNDSDYLKAHANWEQLLLKHSINAGITFEVSNSPAFPLPPVEKKKPLKVL